MEKEWKPFLVKKLFDRFEPGKGKGANHLTKAMNAGIPYIGATNRNNGVKFFVETDSNSRKMIQDGDCIGFIKNGNGSAGYAIYCGKSFISTSDVIYAYKDGLEKDIGLFLVTAQDMIYEKYSHGYKRNQKRLLKDHIMLPVTEDGSPDWAYMSSYMEEKRKKLLKRYKEYITNRLAELEYKEIPKLDDIKWKTFTIENVFTILSGKRLEKRNMTVGKRPFIGASDSNNGVTAFVGNENVSLDSHVLGVNYNGSVCETFYHPYECIFSDDVKRFHLRNYADNEAVLLFMGMVIHKQKSKYEYAYKFNEQRMKRQIIMLPVDDAGTPDYLYMEQYGKNMMKQKYQQYLDFINRCKE